MDGSEAALCQPPCLEAVAAVLPGAAEACSSSPSPPPEVVGGAGGATAGGCPPGYVAAASLANLKCYRSGEYASSFKCEEQCSEAAEGGHAACIESAEENAWLFENIARDRGPHYVGTYQAPLPAPFPSANWGNWFSPRCSSTYTAWYAPWGEPNDYGREEASSSLIPIILPRFRF